MLELSKSKVASSFNSRIQVRDCSYITAGVVDPARRSPFPPGAVTIKRIVRRFRRCSKLRNLAHAILRSVLRQACFAGVSRDSIRVAISRERGFSSAPVEYRTKRRSTREALSFFPSIEKSSPREREFEHQSRERERERERERKREET